MTETTERRLKSVISARRRAADDVALDDFNAYRLALAFVADHENRAARDGRPSPLDPREAAGADWLARAEEFRAAMTAADVLAFDPSARQTGSPEWLMAAHVRRFAIYICNVYLNFRQVRIARVAGMGKSAVLYAVREVEELRDSQRVEALFSSIEKAFS